MGSIQSSVRKFHPGLEKDNMTPGVTVAKWYCGQPPPQQIGFDSPTGQPISKL